MDSRTCLGGSYFLNLTLLSASRHGDPVRLSADVLFVIVYDAWCNIILSEFSFLIVWQQVASVRVESGNKSPRFSRIYRIR